MTLNTTKENTMEAATATGGITQSTEPQSLEPQSPAKPSDAPKPAAAKDQAIPYRVFQAPSADALKPGDTVTYLGRFTAPDKASARWAAVDDDPELQKAVQVEEGSKEGGIYLLAVAERMGTFERTVEEVVTSKVRR
jgi:hypothetical protein